MEILASIGNHFYGLYQAGGQFLMIYITDFIPWILLMITFMHILFKLIGLERIEKLAKLLGKNPITRWSLMPMLCMMFSGNPMTYPYARFLPENQKVAFFDASISYCHPVTGLFPHANPGELFVYLGIATGVFLAGYDLGFLAISYFLIGILIVFIRGLVTQLIYNAKYKKKYGTAEKKEA
ncbi:PTS glucitol/sorbitol transporter subunit IIC [Acetobacterium carbinolicum]|jgi:PTS system glucitol/sorbitol-specific IIC component|uniref:PTS glucitol/sorbitol transporter subunit IIC n=1 Tax=Acetobacterium TaxID=33951 RepID=UPI000DBEC9C3|nr:MULTISPECIES: PTS glucitol/sorbitol transporter subunit IIC [unclassified Acetobacterium]AWW27805.1 PTS sorbitol transporter subunit IIC [Acetobacterium sp. KB-1]MDK2941360.1 glucitol/sorbitol system component [Acetobacterium sp.]MDZ5726348.1 PTS glucitol/sorbitol transporter subunit IIC [Acetobacterium sp. K1/6]